VRRAYQHRVEGRAPKCQPCRRPALEITPEERESYRQWWLERFTLEEIRELAAGIFGPR